ncbi:MAG: hypothetical protein EP343_15045 [Deltaproteobacteria bacterium]|nr:MAG: hypothetical protein EP343_15045 [Deltaproteobacteria bacterium]
MKRLLSTKIGMMLGSLGMLALFSGFTPGGCGGPGKMPTPTPPVTNCNSDADCGAAYYCDITQRKSRPGVAEPMPAPAVDAGHGDDDAEEGADFGSVSQPCMAEEEVTPPTTQHRRKKRRFRGVCRIRRNVKRSCQSNRDCKSNEYCKIGPQPMVYCSGSSTSRDGDDEGVGCGMPAPSGVCTARPNKPSACKSNRDCKSNEFCKIGPQPMVYCKGEPTQDGDDKSVGCAMPEPTGVCTARPNPPSQCKTNSDCRQGQVCQITKTSVRCDAMTPGCGYPEKSQGTCVDAPRPPKEACRSTRDCKKGYVCNMKTNPSPDAPTGKAVPGSTGDDDGEGDDEGRPEATQPPPKGVCEPGNQTEPAPAPEPMPHPAP